MPMKYPPSLNQPWQIGGDLSRQPWGKAGFTLVELLMAVAISSILLVMLASMLESSLTAYTGQQRQSSAAVESRAGLEILRADLRSYCAAPDDFTKTSDDLIPRFIIEASSTDRGSDKIAFLRYLRSSANPAMADTADQGSVVLVAYAVGFTADTGGLRSQKLYRQQFTPEETYVKLRDYLQLGTPLISDLEWQAVANPPEVEPGQPAPASTAEPVVFQVIQFKARALRALLAVSSDPQSINGIAAPTGVTVWPAEMRPAAVDVLLRVTNRGMAVRLTSAEDWRAEGNFQTLLLGRPVTPLVYEDDPEVDTRQLRIHLSGS